MTFMPLEEDQKNAEITDSSTWGSVSEITHSHCRGMRKQRTHARTQAHAHSHSIKVNLDVKLY